MEGQWCTVGDGGVGAYRDDQDVDARVLSRGQQRDDSRSGQNVGSLSNTFVGLRYQQLCNRMILLLHNFIVLLVKQMNYFGTM